MDRRFETFVMGAMPELLRFGNALAASPHDGADLVQSALEGAARHWRKIANSDDPMAYVKRSMVNAHVSRWRRLRREVLGVVHDSPAPTVPVADINGDLWAVMADLPPRQRAVLVLRYYEDLSEREIAAILEIAPGTVKSQASKGLANLRHNWDRALANERGHGHGTH